MVRVRSRGQDYKYPGLEEPVAGRLLQCTRCCTPAASDAQATETTTEHRFWSRPPRGPVQSRHRRGRGPGRSRLLSVRICSRRRRPVRVRRSRRWGRGWSQRRGSWLQTTPRPTPTSGASPERVRCLIYCLLCGCCTPVFHSRDR